MNRNPMRIFALLATLAVLALGLAGCGGDEPATATAPPAPPPAPPPFQPQPVEVALGESGGNVTLMTTEAGGFTLNGEAFAGGADNPVEGEGGRMYVLTLADGSWSAAFRPMEVMVALGASGESVTLMTTEAGGYMIGGEAFASGGMAMSSAGASYTLTMGEDGMWMAMFMPMTQTVTLGTSGMSVELMTNEAGMWMIGDSALMGDGTDTYTMGDLRYALAMGEDGMWMATYMPMTQTVTLGNSGEMVTLMTTEAGGWAMGASSVEDGYMTTAANGNRYTLTMGEDGMWMAAFAPMSVPVTLGGSGETVTLMTTEAGGFTLNGMAVDATTMAMNSAGERYSLSRGEDGMWMAMHMPSRQPVDLGGSGMTVMLMTNEAGGWTLDGDIVTSDATIQRGMNDATGAMNAYRLTLEGDTWTAEYDPMTMTIGGTGLQAMAREDGTGYTVGDTMSLDAAGMGEVTNPEGGMFRVMKDAEGMLVGARFDLDMANAAMSVDAKQTPAGTANAAPTLSSDDRDTAGVNEKNTMLKALGEEFSMGELLGGGLATENGANIVAGARAELVKIRDRVAQLVALRRDDGIEQDAFDLQIRLQWGKADTEVTKIFGGTAEGRLERTLSEGRVVDAFDRLVDALSSEEKFAAATLANGPDKLQGFDNRNASQASAAFNRLKSTATARLGSLGSTRFGVAVFNSTPNAKNAYGNAEMAQAFAWSTMENTRRFADVQTSGTASYAGRTLAADQAGNLYSGSIEVDVRFTRKAVDGYVTGLARADTQAPWTHSLGGEVEGIHLPTAKLNSRGSWSVEGEGTNLGRLHYAPQAGGEPDLDLDPGATFAGQLLGRGDASGDEVIGTWSLAQGSTVLAGGFGAERGPDRPAPGTGVTGDLTKIGKRGDEYATAERGPAELLAVAAVADDPATMNVDETVIGRPMIPASKVLDTSNANFKYVPRPRDTPEEAADADADEYVVGNYAFNRALAFDTDSYELTKGNWVSDARKAIEQRLNQLRRVIELDNADASAGDRLFANDQRQRLFNEIQAELAKVFGDSRAAVAETSEGEGDGVAEFYTGVLSREANPTTEGQWSDHSDYPVNTSGVAEDAGVIAEIEDVLEALADADAFAGALATGGIFRAAIDPMISSYPSASAIFNRARGKLQMWTATTDYTRLGAWRHQVSAFAADSLKLQTYERADPDRVELGAFAFSPLDPTAVYSSTDHRLYPAAGSNQTVSATYAGRTSAAQGDLFYEGAVEARVFWDPSDVEDSAVTVTVTDLVDTESGEPLQYGYAGTEPDNPDHVVGTVAVESLKWTATVDNTGTVSFESTEPVAVGVNSVTGMPNYRPAYGPYRTLSAAEQTTYGPGIIGTATNTGNTRHFVGSSSSQFRIGPDENNYWITNAGGGTWTDAFGELTFAGTDAVTDPAHADYIAAKTQFDEGVKVAIYPKWLIAGIQLRDTDINVNPAPGFRSSGILLFADGSTAMMEQWFNHNSAFIGTEGNPLTGYQLPNYDGDPLLSTRPDLVWNEVGQPWSTRPFPDRDGDGSMGVGPADFVNQEIGDGAPEMTRAQLAKAFLEAGNEAGKYVNIPTNESPAARASEIDGMFVGQDQDGPLGIIGTWTLTGGAFGLGVERGVIRGAFGADIQP